MNEAAKEITWISAPDKDIFEGKSLLELYSALTKQKIKTIVDSLLQKRQSRSEAVVSIIDTTQTKKMISASEGDFNDPKSPIIPILTTNIRTGIVDLQ